LLLVVAVVAAIRQHLLPMELVVVVVAQHFVSITQPKWEYLLLLRWVVAVVGVALVGQQFLLLLALGW
jgi:hypothetical protein